MVWHTMLFSSTEKLLCKLALKVGYYDYLVISRMMTAV